MSLRVFHAPGAWAAGLRVTLEEQESHYLLRVRRAAPGVELDVLDGEAARWRARLVERAERRAVLELLWPHPPVAVMPLELLLVMPEPRATLDALTCACELGATAVWLVSGDHSPGGAPSAERIARTLRAAQRQCGRPSPPLVHGPTPLSDALDQTRGRAGYLAQIPDHPGDHPPVGVRVDPTAGTRLLVGPEGGLSRAEQQAAAHAGLDPLVLGPWVLRTPTAVAAGLACLRGAAEARP